MRILGKYFGLIWLMIASLIYASIFISPLTFEYVSILTFAIPIAIVVSAALFVLAIVFRSKFWYFYLFAALLGWPYYSLSYESGNELNDTVDPDFSVLNYNVKWFGEARENNYEEVINWLIDQDVDLLCLQEYYPDRKISERIKARGGYFDATDKKRFNVALFSKYPILDRGLLFAEEEFNNVLFADIKIKSDTVRFYSLHLESMGINPEKLQDSEGIRAEYDDVKFRLLKGSQARARQINALMDHVEKSPYPVILAGDFNDVPYSYNYFKVKRQLKNSFEEGGQGFGITYNGKIPFLRIDNQFFGDGLELLHFHTENNVFYSDHFPIIGKYRVID